MDIIIFYIVYIIRYQNRKFVENMNLCSTVQLNNVVQIISSESFIQFKFFMFSLM